MRQEEFKKLLEELKDIGVNGIDGMSNPSIDTIMPIFIEKLKDFVNDKSYKA